MINVFKLIIENKIYIILGFISLLFWCVFSLQTLKVDAVPDISSIQVMINTKTGSFSTEQIEKIVTYPIETEVSGIEKVTEIRSLSKYGLSQVIVIFEDGVDIYFARKQISERLQNIRGMLPNGVNPELAPISTGLGEVLMWTLSIDEKLSAKFENEKIKLQYLRKIQDYIIRPRMKRVPGVAEIDTNGGYNSELHINFDPKKLEENGISTNDLIWATGSLGVSFGGGYIKKNGQQISISANSETVTIEDIENFKVKIFPDGRTLKIKDVCDVKIDSALRVGAATANGSETVLGTVLMRMGENSREVAQQAKLALAQIQLPEDVKLSIAYDREFLVNATLKTVVKNLAEGAGLVILILLLILGNFRAALIVSLAIPFSMLIALKGMGILNISANLMSLGAIDFGLLVDASVVFVENFLRRAKLKECKNTKEKAKLIIDSCSEVASPVFFGLLIIMLVYVPILYLSGIEGKMFAPMAITVLMALGASLFVAVFIIPILVLYGIDVGHKHEDPYLFKLLLQFYSRSLNWSFGHIKIVIAPMILIFITSLVLFNNIGSEFVPQLDEADLVIGLVRDSRMNIDESIQLQLKAENIIKKYEEVEKVFSRLGTPESATDPMGPNFADTFVILKKDLSLWPKINGKIRTKDELYDSIEKEINKEIKGQDISATQPIEMRFNEMLEGSRADVTLRILGSDLDKLLDYAIQAKEIIEKIKGVHSVEFDALTGLTKSSTIDIQINSQTAIEYDLSTEEILKQFEIALAGKQVGSFYLDNMRMPVLVHLDEKLKNDVNIIKKIPVSLPNGSSLPLEKFSQFNFNDKVTNIARRWSQRYSAVSIYLKNRDVESFVKEAKIKITNDLKMEKSFQIEWGGQFENLEKAKKKLSLLVPLILVIIFLLILKVTSSLTQALIIFSAVPLGLAGGVFALYFRNINFSVSAGIGFIALSGIVILNNVVMVSFINEKLESENSNLFKAICDGAMARFRPILMTALVASLGFLPMAFGSGLGSEVQKPLATVVIGGLVTSTFLTLFIVPILLFLTSSIKRVEKAD